MKVVHISYSRFSSYLRCPYQHYLSYVERLEPRKPARPLSFGTDFHALLEARTAVYHGDKAATKRKMQEITDAYYALEPRFQSELGASYLDDLRDVFCDYCIVYVDERMPAAAEVKFEWPILHNSEVQVVFVGILDEIYRRKDAEGRYLNIGEHKTFSRRPDMDALIMNTQKCLYAKACEHVFGMLPRRVIWDYISSTPARWPLWLEKTQRFSTAKSDKITPYSWLRACNSQGITDKKTLELAKVYLGNVENFYFRQPMDLAPSMVNQVYDGFVYTAKDIVKRGENNKVKNLTRDCGWCRFHDICRAELCGDSNLLKYTLEKDYRLKPEKVTPEIEPAIN